MLQMRHEATVEEAESSYAEERSKIEEEWSALVQSIYRDTKGLEEALSPLTPAWDQKYLECWKPSTELHDVARFGEVSVAGDRLAEELELELPDARAIDIPMALQLPRDGSILFETDGDVAGREAAIGSLNNIILRLLATTPPGKLNFTIIDLSLIHI
mgnify:FL=1